MSDDSARPIVIKRVKKSGAAAHGGAWKIAYADFVTAMMAFFLLMWLLGSTAKGDLHGIAQYFQNPLLVANKGGSGTGDSSSVIQGGGKDLTRQSGQVKNGDIEAKSKAINLKETNAEVKRLKGLQEEIGKMMEETPRMAPFKNQVLLDITSEGLRIQLLDEQNRPMFDSASAELKPYSKDILHEIAKVLNQVPNRISLAGHTDAAQFAGGERGFSNWELSANRANASRRELIVGGMDESKVLRVVGLSSSVPFDRNDPLNPSNRRINIIVLNKKTEQAILLEEGREVQVTSDKEIAPDALSPQKSGKAAPG